MNIPSETLDSASAQANYCDPKRYAYARVPFWVLSPLLGIWLALTTGHEAWYWLVIVLTYVVFPILDLYALPGTAPPKPGLIRVPGFAGPGIELEVWSLPAAAFGHFVAGIPAPLGVGKLGLDDGSCVPGFLCEAHAVAGAEEVTRFGGWRAYPRQPQNLL